MPPKFSVTYGPPLGLWPILILATFASKIRNCVLILQRYNLFELFSQSRLYCAHGTKYIALLCFGSMCLCTFQGAYFPACSAVQWDTNLHIGISNMKLLLHASTQIQLSNLRICIFHFSFVPIDLPTVSVCTVLCTYSTSIGICTYSYGYDVRVPYIRVQ